MERLNKYLAHAGIGSRRHCDDLILHGRVSINGSPVRELGTRVDPAHSKVSVDGKPIETETLVYWLVNKPRGYLCTNHDPQGRPRALDLITHVPQRVYTVGRLDEDSEGLLLMTNDGDLAFRLMHPRYGVNKTYHVQVAGKPGREDLQKLLDGVWLSDGHVKAQRIKRLYSQGESTWLEIVLCEGKNREIRRMLAKLEHKVLRLKRVAIGPIRLDRLPKGKSRRLHVDEIPLLQRATLRRPRGERPEAEAVPEEAAPAPARTPRPRPTARPQGERPPARPPQGERPTARPGRPEHPTARPPRGERPANRPPRGERPAAQPPRGERPAARPPRGERPAARPPQGERPANRPARPPRPPGRPPRSKHRP